jgi:hypothetical protein
MATIRQYATQLKDGEPGRRFRDLYEFRQAHPPRTLLRVGLWLAALVLIVGGAAIGWLPGPGGFIAIFGLAIVGMEFRFMAVLLDLVERTGRNLWAGCGARRRGCREPQPEHSAQAASGDPRADDRAV